MKIYWGMDVEDMRTIFATPTGQMDDGTLVYTECEIGEDGAVVMEHGMPKLILNNQYTRRLRHGWQSFHRL